jgi:hypothetical protein
VGASCRNDGVAAGKDGDDDGDGIADAQRRRAGCARVEAPAVAIS